MQLHMFLKFGSFSTPQNISKSYACNTIYSQSEFSPYISYAKPKSAKSVTTISNIATDIGYWTDIATDIYTVAIVCT